MNARAKTEAAYAAIVGCTTSAIAYFVSENVLDNYRVCDADGDVAIPTVAWVGTAGVYSGILAAGLRSPRRLPIMWALAAIVGGVVLVGLTLAYPAARGVCET